MFEALFILTTIDTGTRVARFLLQELIARRSPRLGNSNFMPGAVVTSALVVAAWSWLLLSGSIATIWPMFGIANQLLASVALVVGTTILLREAKKIRYALITFLPLLFVGTTTITAGVRSLIEIYWPTRDTTIGLVCLLVTAVLLACTAVVVVAGVREWSKIWRARRADTTTLAAT
ncbi:MAG TPA: carbon starvation CstA 5TM domain-containing protein, partial [Myxococcota bacterium]|jgi:carbon starvation protein